MVPPGQRSGELEVFEDSVCHLAQLCLPGCLRCFSFGVCLFTCGLVGQYRNGQVLGQDFWGICLVSGMCPLFAPPGAVPVVGGYLYPSVLRSPGVTPQECRAAHGPLHPAVTNPPRLCWFCIWFLLGFSGMDVGYSVWCFFVSGVGLLSGFFALKDLTLVCPDVCGPLSLFLCLVCSSATFFSLSFSLSGAGETQTPFGVWVSPCVSSSWTRTPPSTRTSCSALHQGIAPAPVFFFFFLARVVVRWWVVLGRLSVVFLLGFFWFVVVGGCMQEYNAL